MLSTFCVLVLFKTPNPYKKYCDGTMVQWDGTVMNDSHIHVQKVLYL